MNSSAAGDQPNSPSQATPPANQSDSDIVVIAPRSFAQELKTSEDWWAIWVGATILILSFLAVWFTFPDNMNEQLSSGKKANDVYKSANPIAPYVSKPGLWGIAPKVDLQQKSASDTPGSETQNQPSAESSSPQISSAETAKPQPQKAQSSFSERLGNPLDSFQSKGKSRLPGILGVYVICVILFGIGAKAMGRTFWGFAAGFTFIFALGVLTYVLSEQAFVSYYNLEYALWALAIGLIISNTVGTPNFVRPALMTEFFIKTGLVLLGAEVLFSQLVALGIPGICISWVVTPTVLILTYAFGQKVLKMESRSLNMVISADMSVCGVSAAIATAAACKAKKEELSFAIGISMAFTAVMMVIMPIFIKMINMNDVIGGAWLGGTIDSTGAVAAAGGMLGPVALEVATTIKMIQNILIGATAFGVAVYWVTFVEPAEAREAGRPISSNGNRPGISEIWKRFPKFVLGFILASLLFSTVYTLGTEENPIGKQLVNTVVEGNTKALRGWFFCLAFVSIGLETNFRELFQYFKGGKPLTLYVCGQTLNLVLTLFMAWLIFGVIYAEKTQELLQQMPK